MTHIENPRTKCWKLTVPNKWRETFLDESFWPLGWSHRSWANISSANEKESAKKSRTELQTLVVEDREAESGTPRSRETFSLISSNTFQAVLYLELVLLIKMLDAP